MGRLLITPQVVGLDGLTPNYRAAPAGGIQTKSDGKTTLMVVKNLGGAQDLTVSIWLESGGFHLITISHVMGQHEKAIELWRPEYGSAVNVDFSFTDQVAFAVLVQV